MLKGSCGTSGRKSPSCSTASPPCRNLDRHPQCAPIVLVEGNIGAGKTTLIRDLAEELGFRVFLEPTAKNPYLAKFYADPKKYALKLQLWIFRQRFLIYVAAVKHVLQKGQGVLLDRSVFSDCVFADVGFEDGNITDEGYKYYNQLRQICLSKVPAPSLVLFLDAAPQTCRNRILQRGRECETGIPVSYLSSLHLAYQTFLSMMRTSGSEVMTCDWERFGSIAPIASRIRKMPTQWASSPNLSELFAFVSNSALVNKCITLPDHLKDGEEEKENLPITTDKLQQTEEESHQRERSTVRVLGESTTAGNGAASRRIGSMVAASVAA